MARLRSKGRRGAERRRAARPKPVQRPVAQRPGPYASARPVQRPVVSRPVPKPASVTTSTASASATNVVSKPVIQKPAAKPVAKPVTKPSTTTTTTTASRSSYSSSAPVPSPDRYAPEPSEPVDDEPYVSPEEKDAMPLPGLMPQQLAPGGDGGEAASSKVFGVPVLALAIGGAVLLGGGVLFFMLKK